MTIERYRISKTFYPHFDEEAMEITSSSIEKAIRCYLHYKLGYVPDVISKLEKNPYESRMYVKELGHKIYIKEV